MLGDTTLGGAEEHSTPPSSICTFASRSGGTGEERKMEADLARQIKVFRKQFKQEVSRARADLKLNECSNRVVPLFPSMDETPPVEI